MKSIDIAIIGGGAAGLMAAIAAAQLRRGGVTILERMVRCGSKILISGGGRCNLANSLLSPDKYSGGSRNFIRNVLAAFGAGETIRFFESIGVAIVEEDEGRLFPKGGARQLLAAMIARAEELGVKTKTGFSADSISPREGWFEIGAEKKRFEAGRVVLACGGSACPACG
ncbi:MAG: NAD(P)/FAD-dependent oxidoreductase, partial [bacterium]